MPLDQDRRGTPHIRHLVFVQSTSEWKYAMEHLTERREGDQEREETDEEGDDHDTTEDDETKEAEARKNRENTREE